MARKTDIADDYFTHAFADNTDRWPDDKLLRDHGFVIKYRKKKKPAIWMAPDGSLVDFKEALREVKSGRWKKL
jgi:hypothetical protein